MRGKGHDAMMRVSKQWRLLGGLLAMVLMLGVAAGSARAQDQEVALVKVVAGEA